MLFVKTAIFFLLKAAFSSVKEKHKSGKQQIAPLHKSAFQVTIGGCADFSNCPLVILKNPILSLCL